MKRIQLFEFEDLPWFPTLLRDHLTRYIVAVHRLLGTAAELAPLLARGLRHADQPRIVDLCSGSGGPMLDARDLLRAEHGYADLDLTLTDLYPHRETAAAINAGADPHLRYLTEPVDAGAVGADRPGLRTLVCSMHHMRPATARRILRDALEARQPICVFELSDNSAPKFLWWLAIPCNFLVVLLGTLAVRPVKFSQLLFTYIIPVLVPVIAWDGAVSNARTYTLADWDELLADLRQEGYTWEKGTIKGKGGRRSYLLGLPDA